MGEGGRLNPLRVFLFYMICVYKITSPSGKIYIGSTVNFKSRMQGYKQNAHPSQRLLHRSLLKYGFDNHIVEILEECHKDVLRQRELFYGIFYNSVWPSGLNLALPGCDEKYRTISDETKEKLRSRVFTEKWRQGISEKAKLRTGTKNNMYGKKRPDFSVNSSNTDRRGPKNGMYGKTHSDSVKLAQSTRFKGKPNPLKMKIVLDCVYGVYYESVKESAKIYGYKYSTLCSMLNGSLVNKSSLIYA